VAPNPQRSRVARLVRRTSFVADPAAITALADEHWDSALHAALDTTENPGIPPDPEENEDIGFDEIMNWWVDQMLRPDGGLYEKMVWFWHSHLTTNHRDVNSSVLVRRQLMLFREHALGNFRQLLHAFVIDGALLRYLNGAGSEASNPNENLARELMELFTTGLGNYTEDDIKAAARALAGWTVDRETLEVKFVRERSFVAPLLFRGEQAVFDTAAIVDHLCNDVATATYVANKIFHYLGGIWLPENEALALGRWWHGQNLEVRPLLERIITHEHFETAHYNRPRTGLEFYCALRTATGVELEHVRTLRSLGQMPYEPPNVAGWPTDERWLEPGSILRRGALINGLDFDDIHDPMPGTVDHVLERCGLLSFSQATLDAMNQIGITTQLDDVGRAQVRWRLALSSAEFQLT